MRPILVAHADLQGGLFSHQQALAAGYTPSEIRALLRPGGRWREVRRGWYCERTVLDRLDLRDRWMLKDRAAFLGSRRPSLLSHDSAARFLGIDTLDVTEPRSHLTLRGENGARTNAGVTRHRDKLPVCAESIDGITTTSYARTALDIGRLHGFLHGLVAVDSVLRMGTPMADLKAELARMERHPHIARAASALEHADAGAESVLETLGRDLVRSLGLGSVRTQVAIRLPSGKVAWVDILVGRHAFECEGFIKLVATAEGGLAKDPPAVVARRQQRRWAQINAAGIGVSPIYWEDCIGNDPAGVRARLTRDYELSRQRYGAELTPAELEFAARHPRRSPDASGSYEPRRGA